jgi:radical SAM enzyme (TIGR01210 family)
MCDLWRHTLLAPVQEGDVLAQLDHAFASLGSVGSGGGGAGLDFLKLYNAGSFFDPRAILRSDWEGIASRAAGSRRVVVECHPSLVGEACVGFRDLLAAAAGRQGAIAPRLEVAMGLEVAHAEVLENLNKRMTLSDYTRAARFLAGHGLDHRAFVLVGAPFLASSESVGWAVRTARFAFEQGARVVSLIPVRPGNGALDALRDAGAFTPPTLGMLEEAQDTVMAAGGGLVLADVWDLGGFASCTACLQHRRDRMDRMNRHQKLEPRVTCQACGAPRF